MLNISQMKLYFIERERERARERDVRARNEWRVIVFVLVMSPISLFMRFFEAKLEIRESNGNIESLTKRTRTTVNT